MSVGVKESSAEYRSIRQVDDCPVGYKCTEVEVVPEDWDVVALESITIKVGSGKTPKGGANVYISHGRPLVRSQNVGWGKLKLNDIAHISEEVHETFLGSEIRQDDVLLNITGASIGRCSIVSKELSGGNVNQHVCIIRVDTKKIDSRLICSLILSHKGQSQIDSFQAGGNREGLNFTQVKALKFALPTTKKEQTAIANALSDVDALISSLEKLIIKKRDIKTAAMQQLLTGKKRLPPFDKTHTGYKQTELGEIPEDWEVTSIGEFAPLQRGFDLPNRDRVNGVYPVVYSNGIVNFHNQSQVKGPGVVTGRSGTIGKVHYVEEDYWPHNTSLWVTKFNNADPKFVYYLYQKIGFVRFSSGSGVPTLNRNDAHIYKLAAPSLKKEQSAISEVLSDMDKEIETLEQRLNKTQQIKQGMMQELLTGRTRLV